MIITKSEPYTREEINKLNEQFDVYIKTVIDLRRKICSAGCDKHYDSEQLLLRDGSSQKDLWGGGIDLEFMVIDFNSFINIRPKDMNTSTEIQSETLRRSFENLTRFFFKELYAK